MGLREDMLAEAATRSLKMEPAKLFGRDVFVRAMTSRERDSFELGVAGSEEKNVRAGLLVLVICDEQGNRIFNDSDAAALGDCSAADIQPLFDVAQRLNKVSKEDVDDLGKG